MLSSSKKQAGTIEIKCTMCSSNQYVRLNKIKDLDKRKALVFRCTCGNRFHKKIIRKDFRKIDIISAIANFDIETIWYKIKQILLLTSGIKGAVKIRLA